MFKFNCALEIRIFQSYKRVTTGVIWICFFFWNDGFCLLYLHLRATIIIIFAWHTFWLFSGITLTKLVGVIVLRFAKSEVFVVHTSDPHLTKSSWYILPWSTAPFLYSCDYRSITSKCTWLLFSLGSCMGLSSYRLVSKSSIILCVFHTMS